MIKRFPGDNTNIIDYKQTWSQFNSDSKVYEAYFNAKLNILRDQAQKKLDTYQQAKKVAGIFNNTPFEIDEDEIARDATSMLISEGALDDISSLYTAVVTTGEELGRRSEMYTQALGNLSQIKQGLMDGKSFTIKGGEIPTFAQAVERGMMEKGKMSNLIGRLGQHTSSVAGAAITNSLLSQLSKKLNVSTSDMKVVATYEDTGDIRKGQYRYQTDNKLSISVDIDGTGQNILEFSFNISDKANKDLAKIATKKTTGNLKFRDSTVAATTRDLDDQRAKYNTISYHYITDENKRFSGMWFPAGEALRSYVGYKMLIDMLIGSTEFNDEIDFTVYGGRIIPEHNVAAKLLSQKQSGRYRYQAEIAYYKLLNGNESAVQSENEAMDVIDKMRTSIRASINFSEI